MRFFKVEIHLLANKNELHLMRRKLSGKRQRILHGHACNMVGRLGSRLQISDFLAVQLRRQTHGKPLIKGAAVLTPETIPADPARPGAQTGQLKRYMQLAFSTKRS